jgi:TolB protein
VFGRLLIVVTLLGAGACRLPSETPSKLQGPPTASPAARAAGEPEAAIPPQPVAAPETSDSLRDPRERHLRHVRQLTAGGRVAFPIFAADGQSLVYLKSRGGSVQLQRLVLATRKEQLLQTGPGEPFSLIALPTGALCLALAPASCKLNPLPEPWAAALHCTAIASLPVATSLGSCPQPKPVVPSLPCVLGPRGERACPVLDASGATLLLYPRDNGLVRPLGQGRGVDFSPAFSSDGLLLAWLSTRLSRDFDPETPLTRLQILEIDALPTATRGAGPDQVHEVDPGWFPGKHRLIFASTADDAGGQDYDLFALEADGTGLVRLTFSPGTDRFPALSSDGRQIAWVSERNFAATGDQDLFLADWVD